MIKKCVLRYLSFTFFCCPIALSNSSLENPSEEIPVVFIHMSYSEHLEHSLWQALQYNKNVILISDDERNKHNLDLQYYDITPFQNGANQFASEYIHLSQKTKPDIQTKRLYRWFVLKEFMEQYNIPVCFHCDSDVMIYCNITSEVKKLEPCDLALVTGDAYLPLPPSFEHLKYKPNFSDCTVLMTKNVITDYCDFLHRFYTDKDNIDELIQLLKQKKVPPRIGGMFLITRYMEMTDARKKFIVKNICDVRDDKVFDSSIHRSFNGQFERIKRSRPIEWINNQPWCYNKVLDKMIGFNTLHFSGPKTKNKMSGYRKENILNQ